MNPFDIFLHGTDNLPRTPATALKAVLKGFLPGEYFIHKATSVMPLYQYPFELDELERVLARTDLDLQTKLVLRSIFGSMLKDPSKETALFAAESINILEGRYTKLIDYLTGKLKKAFRHHTMSRLIRTYYETALLNQSSPALRNFYLKECYHCYRQLVKKRKPFPRDLTHAVRALIQLDIPSRARMLLESNRGIFGEPVIREMLLAETEFASEHYAKLKKRLEKIRALLDNGAFEYPEKFSQEQIGQWEKIFTAWTGR